MEASSVDLFGDVVEEHPKAGLIRELAHARAELARLHDQHGGLLTQAQIAGITGLTTARISQLMSDGTFSRVYLRASQGEVLGVFVALDDVVAWLKRNPRSGPRSGWKRAGALIAGAFDVGGQPA